MTEKQKNKLLIELSRSNVDAITTLLYRKNYKDYVKIVYSYIDVDGDKAYFKFDGFEIKSNYVNDSNHNVKQLWIEIEELIEKRDSCIKDFNGENIFEKDYKNLDSNNSKQHAHINYLGFPMIIEINVYDDKIGTDNFTLNFKLESIFIDTGSLEFVFDSKTEKFSQCECVEKTDKPRHFVKTVVIE